MLNIIIVIIIVIIYIYYIFWAIYSSFINASLWLFSLHHIRLCMRAKRMSIALHSNVSRLAAAGHQAAAGIRKSGGSPAHIQFIHSCTECRWTSWRP